MSARTIRVLCVDDHTFLVEGMRSRIDMEPDLEFVGHLGSAAGLLERLEETTADVVLLDIEMPGPDPFEVLADVARRFPDVRTIMFSAYVRDHYIDAALEAGAWGYLCKGDDPAAIVDAVRKVVRGEFAFGPRVLERCEGDPATARREGRPASKLDRLTPREIQVLRMIARGMSRTQIAEATHRSPKTIDNHRAAIMEKLGIHDRVELARFAISEGLVEL